MHLDLIENVENFSFDNRSNDNFEHNSFLSENVKNSETYAVNESSKENELCIFGSGSGNCEIPLRIYTSVRNVKEQTAVMKLYAVLFLPERINQDNPTYDYEFNLTRIQPKVETYNTTYFKQQSKNKTTTLCRPLVFVVTMLIKVVKI